MKIDRHDIIYISRYEYVIQLTFNLRIKNTLHTTTTYYYYCYYLDFYFY